MSFGGPGQGKPRSVTLVNAFISAFIVSAVFLSDDESNDTRVEDPPKRLRMSLPYGSRPDYMDSTWGKMLRYDKERMLANPIGHQARNFRRRFRVPPRLFFDVLVPQSVPVFTSTDPSDLYRCRIPV